MALEPVGAKLLADGVQQYISQMMGATRATEQVGEAGDKAAGGLASFNRSTSGLTVTLGDVLNIGRSVVGMFTGMAQEVIGVISANERISMSMESLIAREYRTADATLSMEDALAKAGPRAEELLGWIRQLAIQSPFDQEGVAMAFKTAQTYGFTSEEAQRLTSALINFAAATGQSSATLNQIAFPLGQLRNSGKALTQDLRQLVTAGVDVTGILKKLGFTWADVTAGAVSSDAFLKEFVSTMENDFGNAAERSAGTLEGLINSMGDLKQLSLLEMFGPLKEQLVPILGEVVARMQQFIPVIGIVGDKLGQMAAFVMANKEEIGKFLLALGAGVATFYLIINAGTIYAGVMALATTVTAGLGAAIAFLLSPIGLVATAIAGLVALFVFSFDEMQAITAETASQNEARFGEMSDKMVQSSAQATGQVTQDWGEMGDKIAQTAAQRQEESHSWGYNLIINFAQGMADALIAVINVLIELGNMIAAWLSPGSPPKITPDIDQWGTEAMNEFLHGFTRADFGILSSLSGSIEGFIRDLSPGAEVDEAGVIPRVLGTKAAITEALNQMRQTGKVGEESFKKIFDALGVANPEVESYIRSMFKVEQATQAVAKAQQRVNDITKKYSEALSPLQKELSEIEKFQREEGRKDREKELQAIIADANAPVEAIQRAQAELRQIQLQRQVEAVEAQRDAELETANAALDKAKAEEEAAKAQMDAQKMLVDAMMENNKLIQKQIALMEKLAEQGKEAGGGAGGSGGAGGPKVGGGGGGKPLLPGAGGLGGLPAIPKPGDMFGGFKETIDGLIEDLSAPFAGVGAKLEELQQTWARVFLGIKTNVVDPFIAGFQGKMIEGELSLITFSNRSGILASGLTTYIGGVFSAFGLALQGDWAGAWAMLWAAAVQWGGMIVDFILFFFGSSRVEFETWVASVKASWDTFWSNLVATVTAFSADISTRWNTLWDSLSATVGTIWATISNWVTTKSAEIATAIQTFVTDVGIQWDTFWSGVRVTAETVVAAVKNFVLTALADLFAGMGIDLDAMKTRWQTIFDDIALIAETVWTRIKESVSAKLAEIKTNLETVINGLKTWWNETWTSISTGFSEIWEQMKTDATEKMNSLAGGVSEGVSALATQWDETWTSIKDKATEIWDNIKSAATERLTSMIADITAAINGLLAEFTAFIQPFHDAGAALLQGLRDGALSMAGELIEAVTGAVEDAINAAKALLGIASPSKVFMEMGQNVVRGMTIPLENTLPITNAASDLARKVVMGSMKGMEMAYQNARPINVPGRADMYARPQTSTVNNNNITGVANANLYNGMDLAAINAMIENTIISGVAIR